MTASTAHASHDRDEGNAAMDESILENHRSRASEWFRELRDHICEAFEEIEQDVGEHDPLHDKPAGMFERKTWQRPDPSGGDGGGGEMSVMRGRVFEKVGVNISTVYGQFTPEFAAHIPGADKDPSFWASGISLVAHMQSPHVPAVHMNTRFITTTKTWFGGGADLNPIYPDKQDTTFFHDQLKSCCDRHDPDYYPKFSKWCDEYFFIKHRNESRGVGGIFYDYLNTDQWENDFSFTQDVGRTFLETFTALVRLHMHTPWTADEREHQLIRRGRYAEFNLVYDRGTKFGLATGGNTEAILMSLPPEAKWP